MATEPATRDDWHVEIGQNAYSSISEMVETLRRAIEIDSGDFDWSEEAERLGFKLSEEKDDDGDSVEVWIKGDKRFDDAEKACRSIAEYADTEEAERAIQEDPLSLQVRSGWTSPGEKMEPEQFELLLSTGGPAVRIVGDIGEHGDAQRPRLQVQDWFKPWTEYFQTDRDVLEEFCRVACGDLSAYE